MYRLLKKPRDIDYSHEITLGSAEEAGALIRNRRRELGYTQEQVAMLMGCSPRLIGEVERGRTSVSFQTLFNLLTGLGIDVTLSVRGGK